MFQAFEDYPFELVQDPVVKRHFDYLYKTMIEKDLSRVVQPYSVMKISQAAEKIKLPIEEVTQHLIRMIQDGKISGKSIRCSYCSSSVDYISI